MNLVCRDAEIEDISDGVLGLTSDSVGVVDSRTSQVDAARNIPPISLMQLPWRRDGALAAASRSRRLLQRPERLGDRERRVREEVRTAMGDLAARCTGEAA